MVTAEFCPKLLKFPRSASAKGSPVEFEPVVAPALELKLTMPS